MKEEERMRKRKSMNLAVITLSFAIVAAFCNMTLANDIPRITKDELRTKLNSSDVIIVDVRTSTDWDGSDLKIRGAVREDPKKVNSWAEKYPKDKTLVFY
jgi:hypothetical protein